MIKLVITFKRKPGMGIQDFRDYRRNVHAPMLLAIPESKKIHRFVVSYPVDQIESNETMFDAMVEAWFKTREDMDGLFHSENFEAKVDPDHINFIDLPTISRLVTEEITVVE
jgi:uncharacterized protein (TIGR02118 family)